MSEKILYPRAVMQVWLAWCNLGPLVVNSVLYIFEDTIVGHSRFHYWSILGGAVSPSFRVSLAFYADK